MLSNRIRPDVEAAPWVIEEIKQLEQQLAEAKKDAEIFQWLQDNPIKSQAFFWHYKSRQQRRKAILSAMKGK